MMTRYMFREDQENLGGANVKLTRNRQTPCCLYNEISNVADAHSCLLQIIAALVNDIYVGEKGECRINGLIPFHTVK